MGVVVKVDSAKVHVCLDGWYVCCKKVFRAKWICETIDLKTNSLILVRVHVTGAQYKWTFSYIYMVGIRQQLVEFWICVVCYAQT